MFAARRSLAVGGAVCRDALAPRSRDGACLAARWSPRGRARLTHRRRRAAVRASATAVIARHGLRRARPDVPEVGVMTVRHAGRDDASGELRPAPGATIRAWPRVEPRGPARAALRAERSRRSRAIDPLARAHAVPVVPAPRRAFPAAWDLSRGAGPWSASSTRASTPATPTWRGKIAVARDQDARPRRHGRRGRPRHARERASPAARPTTASGSPGTGFDCQLILEKSDLTSSSVIASLVDATDSGAAVINMSFGGGRLSYGELRALRYALRAATWC